MWKLFKDKNDINEKNIIGFASFIVMTLFAIADLVTSFLFIDGELVIKRLVKDQSSNYYLKSENNNYPNIQLNSNTDTIIWGVVTYVIHNLR